MKKSNQYKVMILSSIVILTGYLSPAVANPIGNLADNWYIGGSLGQSNLDPDGGETWQTTEDNAIAKKIYIGKNISKQVGLEAFWADLGDAELTSNTNAQGAVNYNALGANVIYKTPYTVAGLRPIGKLGVAKFNNSDKGDVSSTQKHMLTIFAGIGAEYDLSPNMKLRSEFEYYNKDINQFTVGINWTPQPHRRPIIPPPAIKKETQIVYVPKKEVIYVPQPAPKPIIIREPAPKPIVIQKPAPKPQYRIVHKTLSGGSHFASGSAQLTFDGKDALNRLAQELRNKNMSIKSIQITGHTDSVGSEQANQILSYNRANAVAAYLASRGINSDLIQTQGKGESQPIASNKSQHGRAQNRRVEIAIKGSSKEIIRH